MSRAGDVPGASELPPVSAYLDFCVSPGSRAAARGGRSFAALAQLERSIDAGMLDGGRPVWWGRKPMAGHRSPARAPFPVRRQLATAPGHGQPHRAGFVCRRWRQNDPHPSAISGRRASGATQRPRAGQRQWRHSKFSLHADPAPSPIRLTGPLNCRRSLRRRGFFFFFFFRAAGTLSAFRRPKSGRRQRGSKPVPPLAVAKIG